MKCTQIKKFWLIILMVAFPCLAQPLYAISSMPQQVTNQTIVAPAPVVTPTIPDALNPLLQNAEGQAPSMITQAAALTFVALLPYLVILLTAYIKIAVVLSILRNALGIQQSPPNQVINGLALIMSLYVMYPTGIAMYEAAKGAMQPAPTELVSGQSAAYLINVVDHAKEPLRSFLERNTQASNLKSFYKLAQKVLPAQVKQDLKPTDFLVLVPSYIISQLKAAYEIGVLIYLPFFVIDLVTSNILLAMGMMMLSPLSISLPLKLLLLVMLDGWTVLIQGLVLTYR
ncbi:MAG: type III secretion system export apparatus subunit SctR [Parachlamydiales bacterium]|nr:type III secretion system export apparatus subunit SctR [Parachlamydiales bacterium]